MAKQAGGIGAFLRMGLHEMHEVHGLHGMRGNMQGLKLDGLCRPLTVSYGLT